MYKCPRCNYETLRKNDMYKHYNRKKKCDTVSSSKSIEECLSLLDKKQEKTFCEYCNNSYKRYHVCNSKIKVLEEKLEKKERELIELNSSRNTINNTNCNNTYTIININSFQNSDYSKLEPEEILSCCLMDKAEQNVPKLENLLERLHFDKNFPENHNIKIENRQLNKILTYNGETFIEDDSTILDTILVKLEEVIEKSIDKTNGSIYLKKLRTHLEYMKRDKQYSDIVSDELCRKMYNNRNMVNHTHKNNTKVSSAK